MINGLVVIFFFLSQSVGYSATRDVVKIPENVFSNSDIKKPKIPDGNPNTVAPTTAETGQTIQISETLSTPQVGNSTNLESIKNPQAIFQVDLWTNKKDSQFHVGDDLVVYLKTNKDSNVTLFDIGTSGKVHVIFPNEYQKDNSIKAGQILKIPADNANWTFKLQGPVGKNVLKAIATIKDVEILAKTDTKKAGIFQEVKNSEKELARDIGVILKPIDSMQWAEIGTELMIAD